MPQKTKQTPMMEQYTKIKNHYSDAFLFYRLGDFYEMFNEDALKASQLLELTLTSRNRNADEPIPMCGVPYHSAKGYIDTLIGQGYKVAICEQVEDPKTAKGMVKREVVQLITPGTAMDSKDQDGKTNNYLTALTVNDQEGYSLAYADLSTGELKVTELSDHEELISELMSLKTKEIVFKEAEAQDLQTELTEKLGILVSVQREVESHTGQLIKNVSEGESQVVLNLLLSYLTTTQKRSLDHLQKAEVYTPNHFLKMDHYSKQNLELTTSIRGGQKKGTLLWVLDETKTAMGGRLLKQWIDRPLVQTTEIAKRQDVVENLMEYFFERTDLNETLTKVYDLERLAGRVAFGNVNGRDLIQLKTSLNQIPFLRNSIEEMNNKGEWNSLLKELDPVDEVVELIEEAINDEAPISIKDGDLIKDTFNEQLSEYRNAMKNGKEWIAQLEAAERERTGIKKLKIGYNKVFGYYIEISRANVQFLQEGRYERKQTLANAERFITPELKEKESLILEAEEKSLALEYELFSQVRETVKKYIERVQKLAKIVAAIDVLQSFATTSEKYHYVRPKMKSDDQTIYLVEGRHPVVEKVLGKQTYVPNSVDMDEETDILLITGPNMSGKSTYMRQLALTVIMAQIGCFVPADEAELPVFDRIFTRIGAADDLISGQSTFMVEMMEANQALTYATAKSLILFDEIGRGTATYDGMALAEAIIEHIHEKVQAKTLFSTHYHELTSLDRHLSRLTNIHVGAIEENGELVFLHKMLPGPSDKSYGIQVAQLAGLPRTLLRRASEILEKLEQSKPFAANSSTSDEENEKETKLNSVSEREEQLALFDFGDEKIEKVVKELKELNIIKLTPLEALNKLNELYEKLTDS